MEVGIGWTPLWIQEFDQYAAMRAPLPQDPSFLLDAMSRTPSSAMVWLRPKLRGATTSAMAWVFTTGPPHPASIWPGFEGYHRRRLRELTGEYRRGPQRHGGPHLAITWCSSPQVLAPSKEISDAIRNLTETHEGFGEDSRLNNGPEAHAPGLSPEWRESHRKGRRTPPPFIDYILLGTILSHSSPIRPSRPLRFRRLPLW